MRPFSRLALNPLCALFPCAPSRFREVLVLLLLVPIVTAQVPDLRTTQWIRSSDKAFVGPLPDGFQYIPPGLTPEDVKDMEAQCVQMINLFRNGTRRFSDGTLDTNVAAGLRALKLNCGTSPCSGSQAMGDLINNVALGGGCEGAHSTAFMCPVTGSAYRAQNSCCARGAGSWGTWDTATFLTKSAIMTELSACLQDMWDEGIADGQKGHWETMRSTLYSQVSCGFAWTTTGRIMMTQDFSSAPMWCDSCSCNACSGNEACSNKTCVCSVGVSSPPTPVSSAPTKTPTTLTPTNKPTPVPTSLTPTNKPTLFPTPLPTALPSLTPTTNKPTSTPTPLPTTTKPSTQPTNSPTTRSPTLFPSRAPTSQPTPQQTTGGTTPSRAPTKDPSATTTQQPTSTPTDKPTTSQPTRPTRKPTRTPTVRPTRTPTTHKPTTLKPTRKPTNTPTTRRPTVKPTTKQPTTKRPTNRPTTKTPTFRPTTKQPTKKPTARTVGLAPNVCQLPSVKTLQGTCPTGYLRDCAGKCWGPSSTFLQSFGNGVCNDFESQGADFSCQTYCCELGDCGTSCASALSARSLAAGPANSLEGKYGLPLDIQAFTFTSFT